MLRALKYLLVAAALLIALLLALPHGLYIAGLYAAGDRPRAPEVIYSRRLNDITWVAHGGNASLTMVAQGPWDLVLALINGDRSILASASTLSATVAIRSLRANQPGPEAGLIPRQLQEAALSLWVTRNWQAEQVIGSILSTGYYGHRTQGLEAAAQLYFGLPSAALSAAEAMLLVNTLKGPSHLNPWCHPDRAVDSANRLADRMLRVHGSAYARPATAAGYLGRLQPVPPAACAPSKRRPVIQDPAEPTPGAFPQQELTP